MDPLIWLALIVIAFVIVVKILIAITSFLIRFALIVGVVIGAIWLYNTYAG